jgi:hypothetical protein
VIAPHYSLPVRSPAIRGCGKTIMSGNIPFTSSSAGTRFFAPVKGKYADCGEQATSSQSTPYVF